MGLWLEAHGGLDTGRDPAASPFQIKQSGTVETTHHGALVELRKGWTTSIVWPCETYPLYADSIKLREWSSIRPLK